MSIALIQLRIAPLIGPAALFSGVQLFRSFGVSELVKTGRLIMKKFFISLAATSALALGACQSPAADKVEDQAEAKADAIDEQADAMPEGPAKEAMEKKADVVEEKGEEKANAMDDNGEIAPSETGVGDTQKK